jgi:hypothetical protein
MTLPVATRVDDFLNKVTARGRLIFALDATGSRDETWDLACRLQADMFAEAGKLGGLETQLVYFRGLSECKSSPWTSDTREITNLMVRIKCMAGTTQIGRVLAHIRKEHAQQKVNAAIFIGDAIEEDAQTLYDAAIGLGVPIFLFQERNDPLVKDTFKQIATLTNGAYFQFDAGAAHELAELLRAVAAFAVGGLTALADQRTDASRKLLGQMKK